MKKKSKKKSQEKLKLIVAYSMVGSVDETAVKEKRACFGRKVEL